MYPNVTHFAHVLEQPPEFEVFQTEYTASKPLEATHDLPTTGSKLPSIICGSFRFFLLFLLPLMFMTDGQESLDWTALV